MPRPDGDFDEAISIDWSAAAVPTTGADSCWLAHGALSGRRALDVVNHSSRLALMEDLEDRLGRSIGRGRRVLVAIDVSFGFAAGAARILGFDFSPSWTGMWAGLEARIVEGAHNANNRFEVADQLNVESGTRLFWGRPHQRSFDHLVHLPIKDVAVAGLAPNPLPRLRACELLAGAGVISNWMLVGRGSVGGQILTCLPQLERLRRRLDEQVAVWPFQGPGDPGNPVVLAETWHGLFDWRRQPGRCRDEQQVRGTFEQLRRLGTAGRAALLAPRSIDELGEIRRAEIIDEEGWTLGIL